MNDIKAFLMGIKPAILISNVMAKLPALAKYPRIERKHNTMFFQDEGTKRRFEKDAKSAGFRDIVGHYLGYPPKAVEWFGANMGNFEKFELEKVGVKYLGRQFTSSIDDLEDNVRWLWENVSAPDLRQHVAAIEKPIGYKIVERNGMKIRKAARSYRATIDYEDIERLREVVKELKTIREERDKHE
jgi:hypothetical protein